MAEDGEIPTDRLFPTEDSAVVERPIPIGPSIRQEFVLHRRYVDKRIDEFGKQLTAALERLSPEPSPASVMKRMGRGAALGGKYGAVILAALGLVQGLVKVYRPDLAGPFDALLSVIGAQ